jgi:hypothetical protein
MYTSVKKVLDAGGTAVWVTGEDMRVLEANWLIQELAGRKVPQDISLLGFENPVISEFQRPALTTLASPLREIAAQAVATVLDERVEGVVKRVFATRLIERDSVRRILRAAEEPQPIQVAAAHGIWSSLPQPIVVTAGPSRWARTRSAPAPVQCPRA